MHGPVPSQKESSSCQLSPMECLSTRHNLFTSYPLVDPFIHRPSSPSFPPLLLFEYLPPRDLITTGRSLLPGWSTYERAARRRLQIYAPGRSAPVALPGFLVSRGPPIPSTTPPTFARETCYSDDSPYGTSTRTRTCDPRLRPRITHNVFGRRGFAADVPSRKR